MRNKATVLCLAFIVVVAMYLFVDWYNYSNYKICLEKGFGRSYGVAGGGTCLEWEWKRPSLPEPFTWGKRTPSKSSKSYIFDESWGIDYVELYGNGTIEGLTKFCESNNYTISPPCGKGKGRIIYVNVSQLSNSGAGAGGSGGMIIKGEGEGEGETGMIFGV